MALYKEISCVDNVIATTSVQTNNRTYNQNVGTFIILHFCFVLFTIIINIHQHTHITQPEELATQKRVGNCLIRYVARKSLTSFLQLKIITHKLRPTIIAVEAQNAIL